MYYKIRNKILFRQYGHYGYITDNSEFGFRLLNDTNIQLGETFVSEVGSIMLSKLSKNPREIDDIIDDLMEIFQNVERKTVKADTMEFFQQFVNQGYLSAGASPETCLDQNQPFSSTATETDKKKITSSEEEGSIPPIGPNDFLRSIHFDVASACNEHCVHCYVPDRCKTKTIESKLFFQVLQEARDLNAIHVTLSGGEPLLHKDLTAFLERSRELDLSVNVLSNLTLLTDDIIAEMKRNPLLSVQTSLYSMDAQTHDSITGLPGSFEKTVSGVLRVSSAGIPVQISCPIMKQNVDSFFDVVVWGKRQNIAVAVEPMIFASYDHSRNNVQNRISPIQFKNHFRSENVGKLRCNPPRSGNGKRISNRRRSHLLRVSVQPLCVSRWRCLSVRRLAVKRHRKPKPMHSERNLGNIRGSQAFAKHQKKGFSKMRRLRGSRILHCLYDG